MSNKNQKTSEKKDETEQAQVAETQQPETPAQAGTAQTAPAVPTDTPSADDSNAAPADEEKDETAQIQTTETKNADTAAKTVKMVLKHKSHTPHYHRCGLTLTKAFAEYEVPAESVEKLKADKWIVVQESK